MFIALKDFFKTESASSILLAITVVLAMVAANSPLASYYDMLHGGQVTLVINDGLMALFFLVIGIELKHEISHGELSTRGQAMLPVVAALGGVVLPAIIYSWFNAGQEGAHSGDALKLVFAGAALPRLVASVVQAAAKPLIQIKN